MNELELLKRVPHPSDAVEKVVHELNTHHPLTGKQLREATGLPRRTLYTALQKLKELGLVKAQLSLRDSRQSYFWLEGQKPNG